MEDDVRELARQYDVLSHALLALDERVRKLESLENTASSPEAAETQQVTQSGAGDEAQQQLNDNAIFSADNPVAILTLIGRTLIVLGGGYLLRMLTDNDIVSKWVGVLAGLAYAFTWLLLADRENRQSRRASGFFHGLAAALISYPLIWETTARFKLIDPQLAALMLGVVTVAVFIVAVRGKLGGLAWLASLFAVATAWSLALNTLDLFPFAVGMFVLVIATEWLALRDEAPSVRWVSALAVDGVLLMMAQLLTRAEGLPEHYAPISRLGVLVLGLMLMTVHLISTGVRTTLQGKGVTPFDVVQTAIAILVGFGAIGQLTTAASMIPGISGVFGVILALACYALAFGLIRPRTGLSPAFFYFTSAAAALGLIGSYVLLGATMSAAVWLIVALVALWLGVHYDRITLRYHGAIYLIAGGISAGLLSGFRDGMLANAHVEWTALSPGPVVSLCVTLVGYGILVSPGRVGRLEHSTEPWFELLPHVGVAIFLGWAVACAAAGWIAMALAVAPGPRADPAFLSTVRTAVLTTVAILCAWVGRRWARRELTWLVWPILLGEGMKLLLEDFRHGRPLTLFLALALYGGALVIVPRLLRRRS